MENFYSHFLANYSKYAFIIIIFLLSFFAYSSGDFRLDASSDTLVLENDDDLKKFRDINKNYQSNEFLIVTFTDPKKIITDKNLDLINEFILKVELFKWVKNTQSIFNVPLLEVNNQTLTDLVDNVLTIESEEVSLFDAEKELSSSPIFKNLIISEDGTSTGILINIKKNNEFDTIINERDKLNEITNLSESQIIKRNIIDKKYEILKRKLDIERSNNIQEIRNLIGDFENKELTINLGGVPMIADDTIRFVKNDILIFGTGAFIFILSVLFIVFRDPIWMIVCITNCIASLIFMIGSVSLLNWKVTVISSNFIMLILILSLSMTVHIVVRYKQLINTSKGNSRNQIITETFNKMLRPCLFAALTTIFAFATLYTSGIKPVMDFGLMMCVGLLITFLVSFTFLPLLLQFINIEQVRSFQSHQKKSLFVKIVSQYPAVILLISIVLLCFGIFGMTNLKVENSFVDYFKKDTQIYKGMKLIDDKLGGTTPLDIIINFEDTDTIDQEYIDEDLFDFGIEYNPSDYWFTEEKINIVKNIHDHLESYSFSGKVLSLASIVRTAEKLNDDRKFDTLELSILYKKLPEDLKDQILKPYVLIDQNQARITMRVIDTHPELERSKFIDDLKLYFKENYSNIPIKIEITGILVLYNNMLESLFDSQIKSLSIVLIGIFLMLIFLFRSIKIAFAAIIPNVIACFVILGLMGLMTIPLDLMTITIASITIGIAVDNSIHYVYRYREYFYLSNNHDLTVLNCYNSVGVAIRNTSITIMAGFSILIFSNFYPTIYFGLFTALAMLIAYLGSLSLLPVILRKFL